MSIEFAVTLNPDRRLRAGVLVCARITIIIGVVYVVAMPIAIWVRALLLAAFAWQCRRDICRQARGYARIARLCIDSAGEVQGRGPLGQTYQLRLCSGSMVLPRLAWLRLEFADGHRYGELIYGNSAESAEWHGLQLIWEQRRASFGRAGLS